MSAVYGTVGFGDEGAIRAMGDRLAHRGGQRREWRAGGDVWFGCSLHRQGDPLLRQESLSLACDADLFGSEALREELVERGHAFQSESDEETLFHAFLEFGPDGFRRLNGYFACAIWDDERRSLLLARDPAAFRPLFFWQEGDRIAFASEYKALLALDEVPAKPDLDALQYLQSRKLIALGKSLLEGIHAVRPATWVRFRGAQREEQRYSELTLDLKDLTREEHAGRLRERFLESIRLRTAERDRVGVSLSGGIDSTCIVAACRQLWPEREIHTFTAGSGPDDGDVRTAREVARRFGTVHHEITVGPDLIAPLLPLIVWHLEDPIARSETLQYYVTAEAAAQHVDVLLGGQTADGLYAGMPKHKIVRLIEWIPWARRPLSEFYGYTQTGQPPASLLGRLLVAAYFRRSVPPVPIVLGANGNESPAEIRRPHGELLNEILLEGMKTAVPQWLPKIDRLNMAHGVRVYSPFIDEAVVRNAFEIPGRLKIRHWQEKHILRRALLPLLPEEFVNRPKFPQRMTYDLAFSESLEKVARLVLSGENVRERGLFDPRGIERILERRSGRAYSAEHGMRVWTALLTEVWARVYLDGRGEKPSWALSNHTEYSSRSKSPPSQELA